MRMRAILRGTGRALKAAIRTGERLSLYGEYSRSLRAGYAGKPMQTYYEKELFGVDTQREPSGRERANRP